MHPASLPGDRKFVYPWFGWQVIEDRYAKTENLDLIGRTEDQYLGRSLYGELGYSAPPFGGIGRSWLVQATASEGWQSDDRRYLFLNSALAGRIDDGAAHNVSLSTGGRYFQRLTDRDLFYASLSGTTTHRLDADQQLLLGGDNGLRGYPLRYQAGDRRFLVSLEQRFYGSHEYFHLVTLGAAAFFDAGRAWFVEQPPTFLQATGVQRQLLKDVGAGLRLGSSRSATGAVIHLDVAYPLDRNGSIKALQYLVTTSQTF